MTAGRKPTKPKTKVEVPTLTKKELEIVTQASQKFNALGAQFQLAQGELRTILTLVGDRVGLDLLSGAYQINDKGQLIKAAPKE